MPRLRRRGHSSRKPMNPTEARIEGILEDLRQQRKKTPGGPWYAPNSIVGILAVGRFRTEIRAETDGDWQRTLKDTPQTGKEENTPNGRR